jgi:hypothetical protein
MKRKHQDVLEPLSKLQKDMENADSHFRQNAVIGFGKYFENEEARKNLKEAEKAMIVNSLLKCLKPKEESMDVKTRTVKVFKEISAYLKDTEIIQIFSNIINYITDESTEEEKDKGKDIFVNCIKTLMENVPGSYYETIGKIIVPTLTKGLDSKNQEIVILCLDTLNDYIKKFDYELIKKKYKDFKIDEGKIVKVALNNINSTNDLLKANSIEILGTIGILLNKNQIDNTTKNLIQIIKNSQTITEKKNYILALKSLGHTLSRSQDQLVPEIIELLINFIKKNFLDSEGEYDEKNSLVEAALNCIEIYVITSVSLLKDKLRTIIDDSLELLKYDPGNTNNGENIEIEGYEDYMDDMVDANLEDSAWIVRRAASRILRMILASGTFLEVEVKEKIITELIQCLGEQEENAKLEINNCLRAYLDSLVHAKKVDFKFELMKVQSIIVNDYIPKVSKTLIENILKDLKSGYNDNIINSTLKLLPSLAIVCPDQVIDNFQILKEGIDKTCFKSNENTMILMTFLSSLFLSDDVDEDYKNIYKDIITYLKKGIANSYYKVSTEAIKATGSLFRILSQDDGGNKEYIMSLYNDILPKFKAQDIDPEIKIASSNAIADFIEFCGKLLKEKEINELFKVYIEKTNNDLIKAEILKILNEIFTKDISDINLDSSIAALRDPLLNILDSTSQQIQIKILILFETFYKKFPNSLKNSTNVVVDKLLKIKIKEGVLLYLFNIFKNMFKFLNDSMMKTILDYIENRLNESAMDNSFLTSVFEFTRLACTRLPKKDLIEKVKKYSPKMKDLNENISYYFSIIICNSGEEPSFLSAALKQLEDLGKGKEQDTQKQLETVLNLIGDVCENSQNNHDDLLSKLEKLKKQLGNKISDSVSKINGKIGVNNPIGFINNLTSQAQDQDSRVSLKEFLNLVEKKNIKITDANIDGLIVWLLKTPKLEEENVNKYVGTCIGLIVKLDKDLVNKYINLLKENNGFKKSSLLNGAKEIFKSKIDFPEATLKPLYEQILAGIKSKERLIKEHSLQALSYIQYKYPKTLLDFYNNNENRAIIAESCKIDPAYIREADFGNGNKIVEDGGKGIRQAALDIQTFIITKYPAKVIFEELIPLMIVCLIDTEDYLQQIAFSNLIRLAKIKPTAFLPFGSKLVEGLFPVFKALRIEESKRSFSINVKNLFEELKDVESVTNHPKYNSVVDEIKKH